MPIAKQVLGQTQPLPQWQEEVFAFFQALKKDHNRTQRNRLNKKKKREKIAEASNPNTLLRITNFSCHKAKGWISLS